jgi:hypothetical protein
LTASCHDRTIPTGASEKVPAIFAKKPVTEERIREGAATG